MPSRIAARLVTGPVAFLVGGVLDVLGYAVASARVRALARRDRSSPRMKPANTG